MDSILSAFCCPCITFTSMFGELKERQKILDITVEKITKELDVISLLQKVRLSHDLWSNMLRKD